jgi:hypothetical protein
MRLWCVVHVFELTITMRHVIERPFLLILALPVKTRTMWAYKKGRWIEDGDDRGHMCLLVKFLHAGKMRQVQITTSGATVFEQAGVVLMFFKMVTYVQCGSCRYS